MQVQAGMCRKSKVGKNTAKNYAECDTHRKTPKKTMRHAELDMFLHGAARRLAHFFCYKAPQKPMRKQKQSSIAGEQSAKTQHMPAKESHHTARRQTQRLPKTTKKLQKGKTHENLN